MDKPYKLVRAVHNFLVLRLLLAAVATGLSQPGQPMSQVGVPQCGIGADYKSDGLAVSSTAEGARLRCVFQRLEGEATREGLWLTSTVRNSVNDRFRIVAATIGREAGSVERRSVQRDSVEAGALARPPDALSLYAPRCHAQRLS